MAVPPLGAQVVFEDILKTFAGIEYDYVEPIPKLQLENLRGKKKITLKEIVPLKEEEVYNV